MSLLMQTSKRGLLSLIHALVGAGGFRYWTVAGEDPGRALCLNPVNDAFFHF